MKFNKIKLFGLAALLTANLSAKAAGSGQFVSQNDSIADKIVRMDNLTVQQMETFIAEANVIIANLRQKIRNPLTTKEERLKAYKECENLENSREDMQKRLEAMRNGSTTYVIPTDTLGQNMTIEQMQKYINTANKELQKLLKVVDSPKISMEEHYRLHHECRRLRRNIDAVQKRLDEARRTIAYNSVNSVSR
ncbi:MAG: hypothetical protein IKN73_01180 [Alphaproteobacteria bacterium]|nr:hypothetical protein [Alphaproteobacteria bacterium]